MERSHVLCLPFPQGVATFSEHTDGLALTHSPSPLRDWVLLPPEIRQEEVNGDAGMMPKGRG